MRDQLLGLLEKADLALGSSRDVLEEETLAALIEAVTSVRTRLIYPEDVLVVAFAGGTGSGKSSLFNALAGAELVDVGGIRPTTSHPAAAVPALGGDSINGYLDRLGIEERHVYEGWPVCLIDLPDTDSVEMGHRYRADRMLPLVDVVVWVTDPEKYRDARLHNGYLKPLSPHSDQFIFVMNQIDRLPPEQVAVVCDDLATALEADGAGEQRVIPTAAAPSSGPPIGLDQLSAALDSKRENRTALYGKLLTDLALTARALADEAGEGLEFDARAEKAVAVAAKALRDGDAPAAVASLTRLLDSVAVESGSSTASTIGQVAADVSAHIDRIHAQLRETAPAERKGWLRRRRHDDDAVDVDRAQALLSEAVIRPARAVLARRALAIASIADLALDVDRLRREI
jgi:energy-coupling factor transporter ATP-binding protein EcfA2